MQATEARALLAPGLAAILFAGSFPAAARAIEELGPLTATLARYLVALALLAVLARARPARTPIPPGTWPRLLLLGLTGIVGYHAFFFAALAHTTTTSTALVNATSPVLTGLLAALVARERLAARAWVGIGASVFGVWWLLTAGDPVSILKTAPRRGELYMLGAVACWAVYAVAGKPLFERHGSLAITLRATAWGVALTAPAALVAGGGRELTNLSAGGAAAVVYMGAAASCVGYLVYGRSVATIGATRTASVVYGLVPILVALLAYALHGAGVDGTVLIAAVLIVMGLSLTLRG